MAGRHLPRRHAARHHQGGAAKYFFPFLINIFPFLINIFSGVAGGQHLQVSVDVPAAPRGRPEGADVPGGEHADGGGGAPGLVETDSPL